MLKRAVVVATATVVGLTTGLAPATAGPASTATSDTASQRASERATQQRGDARADDRRPHPRPHPTPPAPPKVPTAVGSGGAVSSVDPYATQIGLQVLRKGGNATDAAVATAAALGVTEPYSSGIGGGGYFVHRDGETGEVTALDGRETAPAAMPNLSLIHI